jgi:hypothetical protein
MMVIGDATTWSITSDNSRGVIYNHNIFMIQATDHQLQVGKKGFITLLPERCRPEERQLQLRRQGVQVEIS